MPRLDPPHNSALLSSISQLAQFSPPLLRISQRAKSLEELESSTQVITCLDAAAKRPAETAVPNVGERQVVLSANRCEDIDARYEMRLDLTRLDILARQRQLSEESMSAAEKEPHPASL